MHVLGANLKALKAKAISDEISKPLLKNVNEPACVAIINLNIRGLHGSH
jgi:hypothetical protein